MSYGFFGTADDGSDVDVPVDSGSDFTPLSPDTPQSLQPSVAAALQAVSQQGTIAQQQIVAQQQAQASAAQPAGTPVLKGSSSPWLLIAGALGGLALLVAVFGKKKSSGSYTSNPRGRRRSKTRSRRRHGRRS